MQRNAFTGPGFADLDMSGEKDTKLREGLTFNLRVDAFDILNHPNFGQPSGNVQSSSFGQITGTRFAVSDGGSSRQLRSAASLCSDRRFAKSGVRCLASARQRAPIYIRDKWNEAAHPWG